MNPKTIVASGYFDPLTVGHVEYLEKARQLGDRLVVIVNTDEQSRFKKGFHFMCEAERVKIVSALKSVDEVMLSIDTDRTVCRSIEKLAGENQVQIFAKGGDTNLSLGNIPESAICDKLGIKIIDGLGDKIQSSRWLLRDCKKALAKIDDKYLNEGSM
jgi:cytidyltransferase-like protein